MSVLIFLIVLYLLNSLTMMKLFEKAGIPARKALIPGVAAVEWSKMVGRKPSYALWLLVPIVNFFIYAYLCIDMVRSFGKFSFVQSVLAVVFAPIPFYLIGRDPNAKYEGPVVEREREYHKAYNEAVTKNDKLAIKKLTEGNPFRKSSVREWSEAIIFAVFAAAFIRMFIFEAYVIPTPSMEGSLKVGDFLFVSKPTYGLRTPMTVIQFPLVHNHFTQGPKKGIYRLLSFLDRESYLDKPSLPYHRFPGWEEIERNKPVVFNFPAGDSVVITPGRVWDIYQWRRNPQNPKNPKIITRPLDKKDHYIKRCVAIPGDSLFVRDAQLYINGAPAQNPRHRQLMYHVTTSTTAINLKKLAEWGVSINELGNPANNEGYFNLDDEQVQKIKSLGADVVVERTAPHKFGPPDPTYCFPNTPKVSGAWTMDDYGPIYIPKKGATVALDEKSYPFYERIIRVYEHNTLEVKGGKYYLNGQETTTYTFQQDYYWMMGDNRHNSEDSRVWGYVPADHIVGKPVLVWFSTNGGGINWKRMFLRPEAN